MLILTRKIGEAIVIDGNIKIKLLEVSGNQIKLGVEAPSQVAVHREEIFLRILAENRRAAEEAPGDLTGLDEVFNPTPGASG